MGAAIKGSFGKDKRERNGLDWDRVDQMADADPATPIMVVGMVLPDKLIVDRKTGVSTNKFELDAVEVVTGEDAATVRVILDKIRGERTGQHVPPSLFDNGTPMEPSGEEIMAERAEAKAAAEAAGAPWDEGAPTAADAHPPAAAFVEPGMDGPAEGSADDLDRKRTAKARKVGPS
jgi:hypothetical protein